MPTAIDISAVLGLVAVGIFTAQILLGLLLSVGYNPRRQFPRQNVKLFTLHNWLGYIGLSTALIHPLILLFSSTAGFRLFDVFVPMGYFTYRFSKIDSVKNCVPLSASPIMPNSRPRARASIPPGSMEMAVFSWMCSFNWPCCNPAGPLRSSARRMLFGPS